MSKTSNTQPNPEDVKTEELEVKELPRKMKIATVHSLYETGMSIRNTAKALGIAPKSVQAYLKENPEADYHDFATGIKNAVLSKEEEVATKALEIALEKLPEARLYEVAGLYKILRELRGKGGDAGVVPVGRLPGTNNIPPGGLHVHYHNNEAVKKVVESAESEVEAIIRADIAKGSDD